MTKQKPSRTRPSRLPRRAAILGGAAIAVYLLFILVWPRINSSKWVRSRTRAFENAANEFLTSSRLAGSRLGSLYFNLSTLKYVGRCSGHAYSTPLSAYPLGDGFVLALVRPDVAWARNVLATGRCSLIWKGDECSLANPR